MRDCLIMGSGRSGTSMLAGMLSQSGYEMGVNTYEPRAANPKGFFEDVEINAVNDELIAATLHWSRRRFPHVRPLRRLNHIPSTRRLGELQFWLAEMPVGTPVVPSPALAERIERCTAKSPFAYKDPRFSYTLPAWRPYIGDAALLCVFREPSRTANSIVKECEEAFYLQNVQMDYDRAIRIWTLVYRHVLETHRSRGDWTFVHYDDLVDGSAAPLIERTLGAPVNHTFAERGLSRSKPVGEIPAQTRDVYEQLCGLARSASAGIAT